MSTRPLAWPVIALVLAFAASAALAQQDAPPGPKPKPKPVPERRDYTPHKRTKEQVVRLTKEAEEKATEFAGFINGRLEDATESKAVGWGGVIAAAAVGCVSLFFGWLLVQNLLVPSAPVLGVITGAALTFSLVESFYTGASPAFRIVVIVIGCILGLAAYLFSALRARPVATFLVVMSPFLIIALFLFPYNRGLGLGLFIAALLIGFMAMVNVRPLSIFASAVFGACALMGGFGLVAHVIDADDTVVQHAWNWLVGAPLMLLIAWAVVAFVGMSFQFATGPRGSLQG